MSREFREYLIAEIIQTARTAKELCQLKTPERRALGRIIRLTRQLKADYPKES